MSIELGNEEYAYWLRRGSNYGDIYLLSIRKCPFCAFSGATSEIKWKKLRHYTNGRWYNTEQSTVVIKPFINYRTMTDHLKETHGIFDVLDNELNESSSPWYYAWETRTQEQIEEDNQRMRASKKREHDHKQFVYGILQQCVIVEVRLQKRNGHDNKTLATALWKLNRQYDVPLLLLKQLFKISEKRIGDLLYVGITCNRGCRDWMANSI